MKNIIFYFTFYVDFISWSETKKLFNSI